MTGSEIVGWLFTICIVFVFGVLAFYAFLIGFLLSLIIIITPIDLSHRLYIFCKARKKSRVSKTVLPGDKSPDGKQEFGVDGKWHRLDDIICRNKNGYITGSW